jgi:hypothetical protein
MIKDILDGVKDGIDYVVAGDLLCDVLDGAEQGLDDVKDFYLESLNTAGTTVRESGAAIARAAASACAFGATTMLAVPYVALKAVNSVIDGQYGDAADNLVNIGRVPYNFFDDLADNLKPNDK